MSNRPTIAQELMAALAENDALKKQLAAAGHTPAATAATAAPDCSGLTEDQQRVKLAETKVQIAALNAKRDELLAEKAKDEAKIAAMKATLAAISASAPTTPEQARAQYEALPPGDRKAFRARFWNLLGCDRE